MKILAKKNHLFRWSSLWSWWGQNCHIWATENLHAYIEKPMHPKRVRVLAHRHNWAIFLWKWARGGRYSQWRSLSGHVKRIFGHKNWRGGYWQHLVSTGPRYVPLSPSYTRCCAPCFWRSHYQPQSWCHLATSELYIDMASLNIKWPLIVKGWIIFPLA